MKNVFHRVSKLFKVITGLFFLVLFTSYNVKAQGHITYGCNSCHIFHNAPGGSLTSLFGNANLCISCHNPSGLASSLSLDNSDKAIPGIGGTSHAWDVLATNSNYETVNPSDPEMVLRLDGGNIICSTCHDQHNSNTNPSYLRVSNAGDAMCKDCHRSRDVGRYADDNANHKGSHPVGLTYPAGSDDYNSTPTGSVTIPNGNIECSSCHQTHYATTTDGYLLRQTNDDALCAECHTFSAHNGMGCKTCHQTHNTNKANIYMIKDNIVTPNSGTKTAVFTTLTGTNSFADGDGTYDGICEVCHTGTSYHMNDGSGSNHNGGDNCTGCHTHEASFGVDCIGCHVTSFPNWGSTDGHFAHATKYSFSCSTCHNGYGMGGSLEPTHPSGGSVNFAFDPNGLARRNGNDANTPVYNGDLTCDNVYCHSDGRSAYRGTDGTYTWSATTGSQTGTYATTPVWTSINSITTCIPCHSGIGNMIDPYLIITPGPADPLPPATGEHRRNPHVSNNDLSGDGWTRVNCFWCHNAANGDGSSPILQGTYGTSLHVDGTTHFDPRLFSSGGTLVNATTRSYDGGHCGVANRACW